MCCRSSFPILCLVRGERSVWVNSPEWVQICYSFSLFTGSRFILPLSTCLGQTHYSRLIPGGTGASGNCRFRANSSKPPYSFLLDTGGNVSWWHIPTWAPWSFTLMDTASLSACGRGEANPWLNTALKVFLAFPILTRAGGKQPWGWYLLSSEYLGSPVPSKFKNRALRPRKVQVIGEEDLSTTLGSKILVQSVITS